MIRPAVRPALRIACVLLAAGGSRRLGRPKQLVRHRGRPLLLHAVAAAQGALPAAPLVVVLGAHALRLRLMLGRAGVRVVTATNPDWASGLASSLRTGIAAVPRSAQAVLVTLVDQPQVDAAALRRLLAAWQRRPGAPAAAYYDGHAGVPAIVPRRHFRALRALQGDSGARALLRQAGELTVVELPEAALDIDTAADVARLR